ncbi:MAG: thiamine phosphate synthase [Polaribacter sp.]
MVIPKLHYISQGNSAKEHLENIQKACSSGAELVQLHLKNVSEKEYLKIAEQARELTAHFQTRLLINEYYKIAKKVKADGVHLENTDFDATTAIENLYSWQIIGATANTLQECKTLVDKKVDYITLHPFRASEIKNTTVLGLNGFTAIIDALKTQTPIIGFGGITTKDVTYILETGISGLAVSEAITNDFNTIKEFNLLLKASSTDEMRYDFK